MLNGVSVICIMQQKLLIWIWLQRSTEKTHLLFILDTNAAPGAATYIYVYNTLHNFVINQCSIFSLNGQQSTGTRTILLVRTQEQECEARQLTKIQDMKMTKISSPIKTNKKRIV